MGKETTAEWFQRIHPKTRIYEVPLEDDVYRERREFELADTWRVMMRCVGIDRKNKIAKYKRDEKMYFGGVEV